MILYKFRKKAKNAFMDNINFIKINIVSLFTKSKIKVIYFDITGIALNRYLFNLIHFFKLNGFTVYLPNDKNMISVLSKNKGEFKFASWILKENIKLGIPKKKEDACFLKKKVLSNDYFNPKYKDSFLNVYHVPMSQFPYMYFLNEKIDSIDLLVKRKRSIFMCGNFNPDLYSSISNNTVFNIYSRKEIVDFIHSNDYYYKIESYADLIFFIKNKLDNKVLLIDSTNDFNIELNQLKFILNNFDFYLALPGIIIPQSHNLIEAMEMGCIPVIQKSYANLFYPPLIHLETAIVFDSKEHLGFLIRDIFRLSEKNIIDLRKNVLHYYDKYLSPKAIVETIINGNFDKILIQGEHISLNLLNKTLK